MAGITPFSIVILLAIHQACLAVRCFQCSDHARGGWAPANSTAGGAARSSCDEFSQHEPRFRQDTCSDDSCIKKVVGGLVSRYCGPRYQEDGCKPLALGVRCVCSEDLCNDAHRPKMGLALLFLLPATLGLVARLW